MNKQNMMIAGALLGLLLASRPATAVQANLAGTSAAPANRIVGLWATEGAVRACGTSLPPTLVRNTLLFNAGGTVVENARFPPAGAANAFGVAGTNQRGPGLGTWSFNPQTRVYTLHLQFDWYVNGAYHGYQTVDREIDLSGDAMQGTGEIRSTRYAADGSALIELCGTAISDRL